MVVLRGHEKNGVVRRDVRAQTNSLGQLGSLHRRGDLLREKRQLVVTAITITSIITETATTIITLLVATTTVITTLETTTIPTVTAI